MVEEEDCEEDDDDEAEGFDWLTPAKSSENQNINIGGVAVDEQHHMQM